MTSREKILQVANHTNTGSNPFWTGHPSWGAWENFHKAWDFDTEEDLFRFLNDDMRSVSADSGYRHPEGKPMFDTMLGKIRTSLSAPGCFAEATVEDVEKFSWPDVKYLDFTNVIENIKKYPNYGVMSGMSCMFFHVLCDFFGMEEYFVKMYTEPEVVEAATRHTVDFYAQASEKFFQEAGDCCDLVCLVNDFGTQRDLLISPEKFHQFVLPGFQTVIDIAKRYGKKVMLHSCGSIYRVIPDLIEAGVDILHPIQARAANMDAVTLAREFGKDLAFCGGVDTQWLLPNGTPEQIREEVLRLREIFGPNYIISPSHEEVLPDIPAENVLAMARAAKE